MSEHKFKVGDRVRTTTDRVPTDYRGSRNAGSEGVVTEVRVVTLMFASTEGWDEYMYFDEVELITDTQTIGVGDTVKATHTDGTTVQGVVRDTPGYANGWIGFRKIQGTLHPQNGWTFEVVSEAVKPPKVGDVVKDADSLPVGTVTVEYDGSGPYLLTLDGWVSRSGKTYPERNYGNGTTIVYLPESAND